MTNYQNVLTLLLEDANIVKAEEMKKYMRNQFDFLGVQTPLRRKIIQPFIKIEKQKKKIDWLFVEECYQSDFREMHYIAFDYLQAMEKFLSFDDIPSLYKLAKSNQWWDTIDRVDRLIGNIGLTDSRVDELMLKWSVSDDFWIRRLAIDHQIGRKEKTNTKLLSQILCNNFGSNEFFINKAIGWSLRDFSKTNPVWVRNFIEKHHDLMAPLSISEGSKYV